jgi:hypothetical protein
MENQSKDILEDLTFINGKEEVEEVVAPTKKTAKKATKKATKKVAEPKAEPVKKYSLEELSTKGSTQLVNICRELGVPAARRKPQMIQNILNNS